MLYRSVSCVNVSQVQVGFVREKYIRSFFSLPTYSTCKTVFKWSNLNALDPFELPCSELNNPHHTQTHTQTLATHLDCLFFCSTRVILNICAFISLLFMPPRGSTTIIIIMSRLRLSQLRLSHLRLSYRRLLLSSLPEDLLPYKSSVLLVDQEFYRWYPINR